MLVWSAFLGGPVLYFIMPFQPIGRPTVVARERLNCGDVLLTQTFTATTDPYIVSFYFRPTGATGWAEYYVDHESLFWRGTLSVAPDRERCTLMFYGSAQGTFSCVDRKITQRSGHVLGAKAVVVDPLAAPQRGASSPMDVGASDNTLEGYPWEPR